MNGSPHSPAGRTQRLTEAAHRECARSRELIERSRAMLDLHASVVASLRAALPPSPAPRLRLVTTSDRAVDLDQQVTVGPLTLLPLRRAIESGGVRVLLTPAEWQLLAALLMYRSCTLSRPELATTAWGAGFADRHGEVEVYISRLRRKLAQTGTSASIRTMRGQGYRLCLEGDSDEPLRLGAAGEGP